MRGRGSDKVPPVSRYVSSHIAQFDVALFGVLLALVSRRREYRKGPYPLVTFLVFPPVVSSSRLITACRILFPNGENDAAAGHAKGNLESDTSTVARTS